MNMRASEFLNTFYLLLLLAATCGSCFVNAQSELDRKVRCADGLVDTLASQPLIIDWTDLKGIHPDTQSRYLVGFKDNTPIFIKTGSGGGTINGILREAIMASRLTSRGIGPRFFGQTFNPKTNQPALVFAKIIGELYIPAYRYDPRRDLFIGPLPNFKIPAGIKVHESTIQDVQRAFDALDDLAILGEDAQFLLTPGGHAVLIDYGAFSDAKSVEDARNFNRTLRSIYNRGLQGNLK